MNYKTSRKLFKFFMYLTLAICIVSVLVEKRWIAAIGIVVLIADAVQLAIFYRCPHCGAALSAQGKPPKKCPSCKADLD